MLLFSLRMGIADYVDTTTILVLSGTFLYLKWLLYEPSNLPPGPRRWPVIGSLLALTKYPQKEGYKAFQDLAKQYGGNITKQVSCPQILSSYRLWCVFSGIYTLKLGSSWMIVLADPALVREAHIQNADKLSDRPIYSAVMEKAKKEFGEFGKLKHHPYFVSDV